MREFVEVIKDTKREYEEYRVDDVFGHKATEEFKDIGIDIHELIEEPETLEMAIKMYQKQIEPNISYREAEFMHSELLAMKKAAGV